MAGDAQSTALTDRSDSHWHARRDNRASPYAPDPFGADRVRQEIYLGIANTCLLVSLVRIARVSRMR
jgi:hypothetical protein